MKAHRQFANSMIPAPIAGPKALAAAKQAPQNVTAVARLSAGQDAITRPIDAGAMSAAPIPCRLLIRIKLSTFGETATPTDASTKRASPNDITLSRPARSANRPLTTSSAAYTSTYEFRTQDS